MIFVFCFQEIIDIHVLQKQVLPSDKISYFGIHESLAEEKRQLHVQILRPFVHASTQRAYWTIQPL